MLKKDAIEDDYSYISDSQLEQMEKLKPLIKGVLYKFTEYKDAPDSMNFFRADVYRYFFLLSFMCEYFENNEISQEHAISLVPQKFASRIKRLQVLKQAVKLGYILETSSSVDKRRRIYSPSSILVRDFIESYNQLSAIFSK
jgi:hypothetical protein